MGEGLFSPHDKVRFIIVKFKKKKGIFICTYFNSNEHFVVTDKTNHPAHCDGTKTSGVCYRLQDSNTQIKCDLYVSVCRASNKRARLKTRHQVTGRDHL